MVIKRYSCGPVGLCTRSEADARVRDAYSAFGSRIVERKKWQFLQCRPSEEEESRECETRQMGLSSCKCWLDWATCDLDQSEATKRISRVSVLITLMYSLPTESVPIVGESCIEKLKPHSSPA